MITHITHSRRLPPPPQRLYSCCFMASEPVAAAMAYGFGKPTDWDTILVFDLGGGTLDLSLLESFEGIMEVRRPGRGRGWARLGASA